MDDFSGVAPGSGDLFRLLGVGWIGALFVAGITILAARWLLGWQLRRMGRITGEKTAESAEGKAGSSAAAQPLGDSPDPGSRD